MNLEESTFIPLLQDLCNEITTFGNTKGIPSTFLPHTMNGYSQAERKIFYFGQDTNGWGDINELLEKHKNNGLESYINDTKEWLNDLGFLEYNNNKSYGFWTLITQLHLRLKGVKEQVSASSFLEPEYKRLLNDFGWGNTNCIEIQKSLENRDVWNSLDKDVYSKVKQKSISIDKLIHTIKAFRPDLVFIFNWGCNEKLFLEGLEYEETKHTLLNGKLYTYFLPKTNTKVIWTTHPRSLSFEGSNITSLIDVIEPFAK